MKEITTKAKHNDKSNFFWKRKIDNKKKTGKDEITN